MSEIDPQDTTLFEAATELVSRLGNEAVTFTRDRIARLSENGADRDLDQAYRLLTEIERLLEKEA